MALSKNITAPFGYNPYLIGSNICNAFVIGDIGSDTEFFMIAAPPQPDSNYPMITGNFLDSEGKVIFKLIQNTLIINPGHCSKVLSDRVGYEIHDSEGNLVLRIATRFEPLPGMEEELWVTTIDGNFFNSKGEKIVEANGDDGFIETSVGCAMGFTGQGFQFQMSMSEEHLNLAAVAVMSKGKLFQPISGQHENEQIVLDGKVFMPGTVLKDCEVIVSTGDFTAVGPYSVTNCKIIVQDNAERIAHILGVKLNPPE